MTSNSEEQQGSPPPENLTLPLAIASRLDAQPLLLKNLNEKKVTLEKKTTHETFNIIDALSPKNLDKNKSIYQIFNILDAINCNQSFIKYCRDISNLNNNNDLMHDFMLTPGGIIAIVSGSIILAAYAYFACGDSKDDEVKQFLFNTWPYIRDVIKALKNAFKGFRSTAQLIQLLGGADLQNLIIPVSLGLGIAAAINRIFIRHMQKSRQDMMINNANTISKIMEDKITQEKYIHYLGPEKCQRQSPALRALAYLSVAIGGMIDSLYLYIGFVAITPLSTPLLITMAAFCLFYSLGCVVTRIYEEYEYQLRLLATHSQIHLALITKELQSTYIELLNNRLNDNSDPLQNIQLQKRVYDLIIQFEATRKKIHQQTNYTYFSAMLLGLKHGLFAYGALASVVFLVAAILALSSTAFPPALLISCVALGAVFIAVFISHSLIANYLYLNKEKTKKNPAYDELMKMKEHLQNIEKNASGTMLELSMFVKPSSFREAINAELTIDASPRYFFPEWFEAIRSFFSGLGKGQKFVDYAFNYLQVKDENGHYRDTPGMFVLCAISAVIFGIILCLRALAKGLGKPHKAATDLAAKDKKIVIAGEEDCEKNYKIITEREQPQQNTTEYSPKPGSTIEIATNRNSLFAVSKMPTSLESNDSSIYTLGDPVTQGIY